jgi:asparagine synthase (glutamine-hydrolysing)
MCSIAGVISQTAFDPALLQQMNQVQRHRGPDREGYYQADSAGIHVGFAHTRLSIVDLSDDSNQPFHFGNGKVLLYNGEIYNYPELREELVRKGFHFRTGGDTEVLALAYEAWGSECLERLDGMFAFAIWDPAGKLFCARDRFGEKPFYFHFDEQRGDLFFASEIKGLLAAGVPRVPDTQMLFNFLTLGLTKQAEYPQRTFFQGISQLPPAHFLEYEPAANRVLLERYWDLDKETIQRRDELSAIGDFARSLGESVSRRMRSYVPIGTSLSGGLDSTSIVALAQHHTGGQYTHRAFSAIFPGFDKDESQQVNVVTDLFGLQLFAVTPTAADLASELNKLVWHQEEPFASSSVYAQYKVYQAAKQHGVTVLLDGQGADEVLAGYTLYTQWYLQERIHAVGWQEVNHMAAAFRANGFLAEWGWKNRLAASFPALTARYLQRKATRQQSRNKWIHPELSAAFAGEYSYKPTVEKLNDIQYHHLMVMGLEELLRYADRNSMAHGCEVRLPYLSHTLVQGVLSLPADLRMRDGYTKWILRKAMDPLLPSSIAWQKGKIGFEPPQQRWMQDAQVTELVHASRKQLVAEKILSPAVLKKEIHAQPAHAADNFDFRCLIAGLWLKP